MSIEQLKQSVRNDIPKTENFLQSVINKIRDSAKTEIIPSFATGGPSLTGLTVGSGSKNVEQELPSAFQTMGNVTGTYLGTQQFGAPLRGGAIGGTAGRAIGELGKSSIEKFIRGKYSSISDVGKNTGTAALTETAIGIPMQAATNAIFSGPAGQVFRGIAGRNLGNIKSQLSRIGARIPASRVLNVLRSNFSNIANNVNVDRNLKASFLKIIREAERVASSKRGMFDIQDLFNLKKTSDLTLKDAGVLSDKIPKDFVEANSLIRAREGINDLIKDFARQHGLGDVFESALKASAKMQKQFTPGKRSIGKIVPDIVKAGGAARAAGGDLLGGAKSLLVGETLESRATEPLAYGAMQATRSIPPTLTDYISNQSKSKKSDSRFEEVRSKLKKRNN